MQARPATTYESISAGPALLWAAAPVSDEDARADDRADAERGELHRSENALQPVVALRLGKKHVEGLSGKKLVCHGI